MATGEWLKWSDGQKREVIITSAKAKKLLTHWVGDHSEPCEAPDCVFCERGVKIRKRFRVEVMCGGEPYTWEMAALTWEDVKAIAEEYGALEGLRLKVSRRGTGRDTRYTIIPVGVVEELPPMPEKPEPKAGAFEEPAEKPKPKRNNHKVVRLAREDPEGFKAYVGELCAGLELSPKTALTTFENAYASADFMADPSDKLVAFVEWLERQANEAAKAAEEAEPVPDLADLIL